MLGATNKRNLKMQSIERSLQTEENRLNTDTPDIIKEKQGEQPKPKRCLSPQSTFAKQLLGNYIKVDLPTKNSQI